MVIWPFSVRVPADTPSGDTVAYNHSSAVSITRNILGDSKEQPEWDALRILDETIFIDLTTYEKAGVFRKTTV